VVSVVASGDVWTSAVAVSVVLSVVIVAACVGIVESVSVVDTSCAEVAGAVKSVMLAVVAACVGVAGVVESVILVVVIAACVGVLVAGVVESVVLVVIVATCVGVPDSVVLVVVASCGGVVVVALEHSTLHKSATKTISSAVATLSTM
jgi:hypothetical protein